MSCTREEIIERDINEYDRLYQKIVANNETIEALKRKIKKIEIENEEFYKSAQIIEKETMAKVYNSYNSKELLRVYTVIQRRGTKEMAKDFKMLINKYDSHQLKLCDISHLVTNYKIYKKYAKKNILARAYEALGGRDIDD